MSYKNPATYYYMSRAWFNKTNSQPEDNGLLCMNEDY